MKTLTDQIEAYFDGRLDDQQIAALRQTLHESDEARRQYLIWSTLQSELTWQHRAGAEVFTPLLTPKPTLRRSRSVWYLSAAASLAAAIALTITVWFALSSGASRSGDHEAAMQSIALLTDTRHAVFLDDNQNAAPLPTALGAELGPGRLHLQSGTIQVMFKSGAVVDVIGPSDFEIVGPNRGHLSRGTVVAQVPPAAHGFTVTAPHGAEIIDLGTRFALRVDEAGRSRVDVLTGRVIMSLDGFGRTIEAGQAWAMSDGGGLEQVAWDASPWAIVEMASTEPIALGNLFDDPAGRPLESAMQTDSYQAVADESDLGVQRVIQGGPAVQELAADVRLDLATLGWTAHQYGKISNDGWNGDSEFETGAISTTGRLIKPAERVEQGVGMHANAVLVIDLEQLRRAGRLKDQHLRFVSDRAGVNDDAFGDGKVHVRLAAVVIGSEGIAAAQVNGQARMPHRDADGVWRFDTPTINDVVLADGRYVRFDLPINPDARYLILIATGAGDVDGGIGHDHTVFSGARLEITP